jgi:hypothetical protein
MHFGVLIDGISFPHFGQLPILALRLIVPAMSNANPMSRPIKTELNSEELIFSHFQRRAFTVWLREITWKYSYTLWHFGHFPSGE